MTGEGRGGRKAIREVEECWLGVSKRDTKFCVAQNIRSFSNRCAPTGRVSVNTVGLIRTRRSKNGGYAASYKVWIMDQKKKDVNKWRIPGVETLSTEL